MQVFHEGPGSILYKYKMLTVTDTRVTIGNNTYPVSNIASVRIDIVPRRNIIANVLAIIGILLILANVYYPSEGQERIYVGSGLFIVGLVFILFFKRYNAILYLHASSGGIHRVHFTKPDKAQALKQAIETAMDLRPR